jgi:hypothetical protein
VIRTYRCGCGTEFDYWHDRSDEPPPGCPGCDGPTSYVPGRISIKTNRSRALDAAQQVAEQRFGLTNMRDNLREGDVAAPPLTPPQREMAEVAQLMGEQANADKPLTPNQAKMVEGFWGGGAPSGAPYRLPGKGTLLQQARAATAAAKAEDKNPISLLQRAVKSGGSRRPR